MKKHTWIALFLGFVVAHSMAQSQAFLKKKIVTNLSNEKVALAQVLDNKPFVLVFFATDCPICQKYIPILRGVADSFTGTKFLLVFTKWDSLQAIKDFASDLPKNLTPFWDIRNNLVKKTKAITTPEAFFFNCQGQLLYRGAIDNWFYELGRYRPEATEHYLKNALTQFFNNETIKLENTKPVGCYIEY